MSALECIERIAETSLIEQDLKYCLLDESKLPFQINGIPARSNDASTFVEFAKLLDCNNLSDYKGVAVSVQASKLCAIDIDHCLEKQGDFSTISKLGSDIVEKFKDYAYVEISFSGFGIRILFFQKCIPDYKTHYYIKNSEIGVEYYQYDQLGRYVSVTGNKVYDNGLVHDDISKIIIDFLNYYMKRKHDLVIGESKSEVDERSVDELMKIVKHRYLTDMQFQDLWFTKAPGFGHDESERDYHMVAELYQNITKDPNKVLALFEASYFFKTKDHAHLYKFTKDNHKYFWYLYGIISSKVD